MFLYVNHVCNGNVTLPKKKPPAALLRPNGLGWGLESPRHCISPGSHWIFTLIYALLRTRTCICIRQRRRTCWTWRQSWTRNGRRRDEWKRSEWWWTPPPGYYTHLPTPPPQHHPSGPTQLLVHQFRIYSIAVEGVGPSRSPAPPKIKSLKHKVSVVQATPSLEADYKCIRMLTQSAYPTPNVSNPKP